MEFLRLGDMTLFICFVQSSLLLPTTSAFWKPERESARVGAEEQNVSVGRTTGFTESGKRELSLLCSSRWSASEEQLALTSCVFGAKPEVEEVLGFKQI